jgi:RNA polymerase sigma-70 factor (ECF subfamily)
MKSKTPEFDVVAELPALMRYAQALTHDPVAAEELVQDALVRAYDRRSTFDPRFSLRAWLFSILHNTFVSSYRRRRAEARREQIAADLATSVADPVQEQAAELQRIGAAFQALPLDQRTVLHLVTVEGLSYAEAAQALEIPVGTVMSRLSRARAALRNVIEGGPRPATRSHLHLVGGKNEH